MKYFGLWDRLALKTQLKTIGLFLFSFFFLYALLDFANRTSQIDALRSSPTLFFKYYTWIFIKRLEVLFPFALLLAVLRTLQQFYQNQSWIAALSAGVTLKRLFFPFYLLWVVSLLFLYMTEEWLVPPALKAINVIETEYFKKGGLNEAKGKISIRTGNGERLFFGKANGETHLLEEVFYLVDWNTLWHIEKLELKANHCLGHFVDRFSKGTDENWILEERLTTHLFENLKITWKDLFALAAQPSQLTFGELYHQLTLQELTPLERDEVSITLTKKILFPWLAFFTIISPLSFGITFVRGFSFLWLYGAALFLLFAIYLFFNALVTLASPLLVTLPFVSSLLVALFFHVRLLLNRTFS